MTCLSAGDDATVHPVADYAAGCGLRGFTDKRLFAILNPPQSNDACQHRKTAPNPIILEGHHDAETVWARPAVEHSPSRLPTPLP